MEQSPEQTEKRGSRNIQEVLLDVGERLFAENGVTGTSIRAITAEAGVNVAAVNYYFRTREALLQAVLARRLDPLNEERLRLLEACWRAGSEARPALEEVLHALAAPSLRLCFEHPHFALLASQLRADLDKSLWREFRARQAPVTERFREAFTAALPDLPADEVANRMHYVLGAIQHVWAHCPMPAEETEQRMLARFLTFYTAGLRAPAPDLAESEGAGSRFAARRDGVGCRE